MKKRFKFKSNNKIKLPTLLLLLLTTYTSFYLFYNIIYNKYLSKLSNKDIINHIIKSTKNTTYSNKYIDYYKNPYNILNNNINIIELPTIEVNNNQETPPLIYIYSTHETESYQDKYLEIYNIKPTVKTMSYILQDYLNDYGINTIIEEKSITKILRENKWSYKYSYEASKIVIKDTINNNDSLKLIIDLHRDSVSLSKTLLEVDNKKYARILFVVGMEHNNYQENLKITKELSTILEELIPNITRGISKKSGEGVNGIYNQNLSNKSILIELGGQYNEIEELNNTLQILSKAILIYLERNL